MTANYTVGNGFYGASAYAQNKHKAELIHTNNLYGTTPKEISREMRDNAKGNRTKKPVLHASFSFHQSERLSNEKAITAVESALKNAGITRDNHQYSIVKHNDTAHPHYHVIINRVGLDQKLHNDYYLSNRLMASCDKVEKDMNLRKTEGRTAVWDDKSKLNFKINKPEISKDKKVSARNKVPKKEIAEHHVLISYRDRLKESNSVQELKAKLKKDNIEFDVKTNKNGIYGVSFKYGDTAIKASKLGIKAKELNTAFERKQAIAPSRESLIDNGIKSLNQVQSDYKNVRQSNYEMLQEHKETLLRSGKSDVNQLAEKYNLNKEPFLSDLRLVSEKVNKSQEEIKQVVEDKAKELKTLMETPYRKSHFLSFGSSKRKVERFNSELKAKQKNALEEFKYFKSNGSTIALKDNIDRKIYSVQGKREIELSKDFKLAQQGIKNDFFNDKGIDLDKAIREREKAQREQEREKSISRNNGGYSR